MLAEVEVDIRRKQTRRRFALGALGLVLLASAIGARLHSRLTGDDAILSAQEWDLLRARWLDQTSPEKAPAAAATEPATKFIQQAPDLAPPRRPPVPALSPEIRDSQWEAYGAERPKSVLELQPFRSMTRMNVIGPDGVVMEAELVNLNPTINKWYLLNVRRPEGQTAYHLVNERRDAQELALDPENRFGLSLLDDRGKRECSLWSESAPTRLDAAAASPHPYVSLCGEEVTLRLKTPGRRTALEWAADFLRDSIWSGEQITVFVRDTIFQDAHLATSVTILPEHLVENRGASDLGPGPARLDPASADVLLLAEELGLEVEGAIEGQLPAGRWLPLRHHPDVFASAIRPDLIDREILKADRKRASALDPVEASALAYLVAFDLDRFALGFALGTEHPRVGWSPRAPETVRDSSLPGPDGIGDIAPIVATGIVPRAEAGRTVATFAGGFKREHGAFRVSDLAHQNRGSHYGFIEGGAILSRLQPGLATLFVLDDGRVSMKTWSEEDDALLPRIDSARQNGLALVETDPETGAIVPGKRVSQWASGNWSGSQDRRLRTVRAGACLQSAERGRFLLYAYFSSATPSAMARVFQAYGCEYAMMLDMNALEHTYLALYHRESDRLAVEHLIQGMEVLDKTAFGQVLPRFLGFADNRDFFYVLRREAPDAGS